MSKTQIKIGNALLQSLIDLHESKGEVALEDVGAIFESMASSLQSEAAPDSFLRTEITKLGLYIAEAKREIFDISPLEEVEKEEERRRRLVSAGLELTEVVRATEEATNTILDATDDVIKAAGLLPDKTAGQRISDAANRVYDACTFQDITGQRIKKVAKTLEHVEMKVNRLVELFSDSNKHMLQIDKWTDEEKRLSDQRSDAHLMQGPAMKGEAPSQADIDKLFSSMK